MTNFLIGLAVGLVVMAIVSYLYFRKEIKKKDAKISDLKYQRDNEHFLMMRG